MKTKEERNKVLLEIESMRRPLPLNPDRIGVASLYELSSALFSYRERLTSIFHEAIDDLNEANKSLIIANEQHKEKSSELLNRDEIKILKPISVQQAACDVHLRPFNKMVLEAELNVSDCENFLRKVQISHEDIKDKIRTLRLQSDLSVQLNGLSNMLSDPLGRTKGAELR
jgi:hypothetical protein